MPELTVSSGLLLVLSLLLDLLPDGLAVRDSGKLRRDLHAELALQLLYDHVQVALARAGQDGLVHLGIAADPEHRVLFLEAPETGGELVLVTLGLGLDRQ